MVKKSRTNKKLVTVVTPLGYLTTTPAIAKKVVAAGKKQLAKKSKK